VLNVGRHVDQVARSEGGYRAFPPWYTDDDVLIPSPAPCPLRNRVVQSSMKIDYYRSRTNPVALMRAVQVNGKYIRGPLLPKTLKQPIRSTLPR